MLIDWFTVVAQAANFLVLVWLLKRFLYHPILNAIDERERRIANRLKEAEEKKAEAEQAREHFQSKQAGLDQQRDALIAQATTEAKSQGRDLLEEARQEYNKLRKKLQESLQEEQQQLSQEIARRARQEVFAISRKALADLADIALEEQMAEVFIRSLLEMEEEEKGQLAKAFRTANRPAVVRSAFSLPPAQQAAIGKVLKASLAPQAEIQFETRPEQVSGIELAINGYKIAWSISDYLDSLENSIAELLNGKPEPESETGHKKDADAKDN